MKLDITLPVEMLKIHSYTIGCDIPSVTWVFNHTVREVLKECDVNGLNVEHSRSPAWRRPLAPLSSPRPGCWTGRSRPVRCDSVVSTTVCRPLSPARHISHLTPQHWKRSLNSSLVQFNRHSWLGCSWSCFSGDSDNYVKLLTADTITFGFSYVSVFVSMVFTSRISSCSTDSSLAFLATKW